MNGSAQFPANSNGDRFLSIRKNGTTDDQTVAARAAMLSTSPSVSCQVDLAAGDHVELHAYQNGGSSMSVTARFDMVRVGPKYN